jgi:hypothetical protein
VGFSVHNPNNAGRGRPAKRRRTDEERRAADKRRKQKRRAQETRDKHADRIRRQAEYQRAKRSSTVRGMPERVLRAARARCERQQQGAKEKRLLQEMEEGFADPTFAPTEEHLELAEKAGVAAQMALAFSSGFADFESGGELPAMPPAGPERDKLLDPDLPLGAMPEGMRKVCMELDEAAAAVRGARHDCLRQFQKHAHHEQSITTHTPRTHSAVLLHVGRWEPRALRLAHHR